MTASRYQRFRKRMGPVAFVVAIGVLIWQLWARDRATVEGTIILDFGDASAAVTVVDLDLRDGASSVGNFHRDTASGVAMGRPTFKVTLANEDVVMIAVVRVRGTVRTIEQPLHVPDDGQVVVRLADELAP